MCKLLKIASKSVIEEIVRTKAEADSIYSNHENYKWSEPKSFSEKEKWNGAKLGVYRIIYKPTGKTLSIGQGNIGNRRCRHKSIFRNSGSAITHSGGGTSDSLTGQKMHKYDSDLSNWIFSWCPVPCKSVAKKYEELLQQIEKPLFNAESMGGAN